MSAVVVVPHLRFKDVEVGTLLFLLYDLEILEGNGLVVNIMNGEHWAGNLTQTPSHVFHRVDQAQARSDEHSSIAEPVFTAILAIRIASNHMSPMEGG